MNAQLVELARQRHELHKHHASSRPLSLDYELVGLAGEQAFADAFGLQVDTSIRPAGDGNVDFRLFGLVTVDVKTARKAGNLIAEVGTDPWADIYVLARYDDLTQTARLLGWEHGDVLRRAPSRDFGYGIINHYIPRYQLKPIARLHMFCN
jgi:hypothetical protein